MTRKISKALLIIAIVLIASAIAYGILRFFIPDEDSPDLPMNVLIILALSGGFLGILSGALGLNEEERTRVCRGCGERKETMALEYGEEEGLCQECLDKYLPLALRK